MKSYFDKTVSKTSKNSSFFKMANVSKNDTGLPYDIWIDSVGIDRKSNFNVPQIMVQVDDRLIPVLISKNPDIPKSVKQYGIKDFPHFP